MPARQTSPPPLPDSRVPAAGATSGSPSFSPLYQQIKALLVQGLQSGEWRPGALIPSELELAARFRVSQGTVRKAVDELAAERLLVRRQGKGTFVATHGEAQTSFRFLRLRPDDGLEHPFERQFIDCKRLRAGSEVARVLHLRASDAVIQVRRILSQAGRPVVLDEMWLPGQDFKGLTAEHLTEYQGPMYALFESEFGVRMIRAEEQIKAVVALGDEARLMAVSPGTPLLSVERIAYTYSDRPVELRRGLYNTFEHHYPTQLS